MALALHTITLPSGIIAPEADCHVLETRRKDAQAQRNCPNSAQKVHKSAQNSTIFRRNTNTINQLQANVHHPTPFSLPRTSGPFAGSPLIANDFL
jgi:hypothetical protein